MPIHSFAHDSIKRDRHYRDTHGRFFVEGVRNFVTAVDEEYTPDILIYSERLLTSPIARKLVRRLKRVGVPFARVSPEQFRAISRAERASGVGAVLPQHIRDLSHVTPGDTPCWIVLNQARAPGNVRPLCAPAPSSCASGRVSTNS